jgi:hypothetical protein
VRIGGAGRRCDERTREKREEHCDYEG